MIRCKQNNIVLSTALIALALLISACTHSQDKPAGDAVTAPIPEGWRRVEIEHASVSFVIPDTWKITSTGTLYKDTPGLEEMFDRPENRAVAHSIADLSPASISVDRFDPEGRSVDQLWDERHVNELDLTTTLAGERARIGECSGIRYWECVYLIHNGVGYTIWIQDMPFAHPPAKQEDMVLHEEVRSIVNSFLFN